MSERSIEVHVETAAGPVLAGHLFTRILRGRESATFRYATGWLDDPARFSLRDVAAAVDGWREVARSLGLRRAEIERMESAFEHDDLREARAI